MQETPTESKIGSVVVWTALAVYLTTWLVGISHYIEKAWLLATVTSVAYVGMHVYEIVRRGHCYLSADSTAVPLSLLVFSIGVFFLWYSGHPALAGRRVIIAWLVYGGVLTIGHVLALCYSFVAHGLAGVLLKNRIRQERSQIANNMLKNKKVHDA